VSHHPTAKLTDMRLDVLGASGTYPTPGNPCSGYLVAAGSTFIWMEAGPGTYLALADRIDPARLSGVVISHLHIDHCADLFALYHYLRFGPNSVTGVPLLLPEGGGEGLAAMVSYDSLASAFDIRTVADGDNVQLGDISLWFGAADHPVPAVAVRMEAAGHSLTYSGDTGPDCELASLARNCDLLLCEATYQGDSKRYPQHLTAREAGSIAGDAGVRRLMLTHLAPGLDPIRSLLEAAETFGGEVLVASPGLAVEP